MLAWVWIEAFHLFSWKFSFWEVQNCGPESPGSVIHPTVSQGSLLILKGEISSVPQRLVSVCPPLEANETFVTGCIFLQRRSPFILLPNGSWKGSTANSQIAAAGELEQFAWWSGGVRKSFCTHQKEMSLPAHLELWHLRHCCTAQG